MIKVVAYLYLLLRTFSSSSADGVTADNCKLKTQLVSEANLTITCQSKGISTNNRTLRYKSEEGSILRITEIYLDNTDVETIALNELVMDTLFTLHLSNNSIRNLDRKAFGIIPNLQVLDMSMNQLTDNDIHAFKEFPFLKLLNISFNNLRSLEAYNLEMLHNLEVLDLSHNLIYAVRTTLFGSHQNLRSIYLHNNKLSSINLHIPMVQFIDISFNEIKSLNLPDLAQLNLSNNKISSLISFNDIEINISYNNITHFRALSEATRHISAGFNQIEIISTSFFPKSKNLQYLDLSNNIISSIESDALSTLNQIKIMNLSHNRLTDFKYRVFDNLDTLEGLDISYNGFIYLYDIPFANSFSFDNLGKLSEVILNNNPWSCNFLKQVSKVTFSVVGAHTTCKSDVNDFVIDFDKTVPIESNIPPQSNNIDEDEVVRILQKHIESNLRNTAIYTDLEKLTLTLSDLRNKTDTTYNDLLKIAKKYLETGPMVTDILRHVKNLTSLLNLNNKECLNGPHVSNIPEDLEVEKILKKELFSYVLLINTITTALLLLVIVIALCVVCRRRKYKVQDYNHDGY